MNINEVNRGVTRHKTRKRIGRGIGSGQGKTAGRGHKGAGSRAGNSGTSIFEGGQMPIIRRIPKRGFHNKYAECVVAVNVGQIDEVFTAGEEVTLETLREKRLLRGQFDLLKVLGDGQLSKALKISAHRFSASARDKIQQSGGEAIELPGKKPVVKIPKSQKKKTAQQV